MKKIVGWIVVVLIIIYITTSPGPAADITRSVGHGIADVFRNIGVFLRNLAS
jgi:hypothetical protein